MQNEVTLSIKAMRAGASEAAGTLKALANENRLLLLCQLAQEEKSVGELEKSLGILQPTLSQQLGVLRKEGLVNTRRESTQIYYSVTDPKVLIILKTLYELYCHK